MEKDIGFRFHLRSPDPKLWPFPFDASHLKAGPVLRNPHSAEDSMPRTIPLFPFSGLQHSSAHALNDFRHNFSPQLNSASTEKLPFGTFGFGQERATPPQKRFLVFDRSGDKTKLIYSSDVQAPFEFHACRMPSLPTAYNLHRDKLRVSVHPLQPCIDDESVEDNSRDVTTDELHEDTEELDALLCSDYDSDFLEDEEEMSTGHSPCTMTGNGILDLSEEAGEEVNSLAGPMKKRQKILDVPSKSHTMSFVRTMSSSALEEDSKSSCGDNAKLSNEEVELSSAYKNSKKAKVHDALSILQSIIPSTNGKDAIIVIDEVIQYLRSLKAEVKALGLNTI